VGVLMVQALFTKMDAWIDDWRQRHTYRIVSELDEKSLEGIKTLFREAGVEVLRRKLMKRGGHFYSEWYASGPRLAQKELARKLLESIDVLEVVY
jgi:hypothetical protein